MKDFIPYEQALELKELGFDEPCFGWWFADVETLIIEKSNKSTSENIIQAPTFSQSFRFFREKYDFVIQYAPYEIDNSEGESILHHQYKISEYDSWRGGRRNTVETELTDDYEEAELECLKKLIEIVKNK